MSVVCVTRVSRLQWKLPIRRGAKSLRDCAGPFALTLRLRVNEYCTTFILVFIGISLKSTIFEDKQHRRVSIPMFISFILLRVKRSSCTNNNKRMTLIYLSLLTIVLSMVYAYAFISSQIHWVVADIMAHTHWCVSDACLHLYLMKVDECV